MNADFFLHCQHIPGQKILSLISCKYLEQQSTQCSSHNSQSQWYFELVQVDYTLCGDNIHGLKDNGSYNAIICNVMSLGRQVPIYCVNNMEEFVFNIHRHLFTHHFFTGFYDTWAAVLLGAYQALITKQFFENVN